MSIPPELLDLARKIHAELGKLISSVDSIAKHLKDVYASRKEDDQRIFPEQDSTDKGESAPQRMPCVSPSPTKTTHANKPANASAPRRKFRTRVWRWIKRIFLKKDRLERIGILFAVAYAIVTFLQWRDLRQNFKVDERAWLRFNIEAAIDTLNHEPLESIHQFVVPMDLINVGKTPALKLIVSSSVEILANSESPNLAYVEGHTRGTAVAIPEYFCPRSYRFG